MKNGYIMYGILKVHHVGYFVKDIEKSIKTFLQLGYEDCGETIVDNKRQIKIRFCRLMDNVVELVESNGEESPVNNMKIKDKSGHPYHICYEVADIEKCVEDMRKDRFAIPVSDLSKSEIGGKRVIHLFNKDVGIFELIEK